MIKKYLNKFFIYFICFSIVFVYIVNVKVVWIDLIESSIYRIPYLLLFTILTTLLGWSLFKTMFTDPGRVPQNWGFFLNDPEQKKRKFCLICHIFKPERCHHCSACNRCVLNMDHHCPWINNCVGFQNRKFFMQMLFYVILDSYCAVIGLGYGLYIEFENIMLYFNSEGDLHFIDALLLLCAFGISCLASCLITMFFKFHLELVLSNRTTIENLEKKRNEETGQQNDDFNQYDLKPYYNWVQVFGMSKLSWFLPIQMEGGRPVGDGILWPKNHHNDSLLLKDHASNPIYNGKGDNFQMQQYNNQLFHSNNQQFRSSSTQHQ
ncbi:unnamed protein product [Paramecium octaurelia]|uniref:Palmitoyltransferase n=1 Tax=Paramecium octaurelia TaxID=43137 RepID=A0A8S1XKB4_PAROT|nr:unnamed protein product [Paramecium octaurelia]